MRPWAGLPRCRPGALRGLQIPRCSPDRARPPRSRPHLRLCHRTGWQGVSVEPRRLRRAGPPRGVADSSPRACLSRAHSPPHRPRGAPCAELGGGRQCLDAGLGCASMPQPAAALHAGGGAGSQVHFNRPCITQQSDSGQRWQAATRATPAARCLGCWVPGLLGAAARRPHQPMPLPAQARWGPRGRAPSGCTR
jgi:hypothetical protein